MATGTVGLWVRLEAQPGRVADLAAFLRAAQPRAEQAPDATAWFSIQLGPTAFGIFDAFTDADGRAVQPDREIADALTDRADELLSVAPGIERIDVLASKLP